jgi:hypothetical protein
LLIPGAFRIAALSSNEGDGDGFLLMANSLLRLNHVRWCALPFQAAADDVVIDGLGSQLVRIP